MASEVLIRFATANLERASSYAKSIGRSLREALKGVQDKGLRGALRGAIKEEQKIEAQRVRTLSRIPTPEERLRDAGLLPSEQSRASDGTLRGVRRAVGIVRRLGGALSGDATDAEDVVLGVASLVPGAGTLVALAKDAADILRRDLERQQKAYAAELEARLESRLAQADFLRRFDEDPEYRRAVIKSASQALDVEEQRVGFVHEGGVPWLGR